MNTFLKFSAISGLVLISAILFSSAIAPTPVNAAIVTPSQIGLANSSGSGYTDPAWMPNSSTSSWVVFAKGSCAEIQWKIWNYSRTFSLSEKADVVISGRLLVDDILLNTTVNGYDVGVSANDATDFTSWHNFTMTIPAQETNVGANTIVFTLQDTGCDITGFRVEFTSVTLTPACTPNTAKQCVGNTVYNFDSCGVQGTLFQQCTANQTCANGSCTNQNITCSANTDCGTNSYTGSPFCQSGNVYQNYITYTCTNPGTASSYCSNNTASQLKTTCASGQTCANGSCSNQTITCTSNTDCGANAYTGSPFCQGNSVYQNYITYTCNNAGTASSYCSNNTAAQLKTTCTGNQTCSNGSCSTTCTQNSYQQCQGNYLYWYDSCGVQEGQSQYCPNGCSGNSCTNNNCTYHSYEQCIGNNLYWYNSCGVQQDLVQYCPNGCSGNTCTNNNNNCTQNSYQQCQGNYLYWYDSCGVQEGQSQYCANGCYNNSCSNNSYNPYGNCTYHAYKLCQGNNIYWYDSCGTQQDFFQTCSGTNMVCQYGQCTYQQTIVPVVYNTYVAHYRISCYDNNLYWYDSTGSTNSLYKTCADSNSCTLDSCAAKKCSNILKCDGSTCATGSADYNTYCAGNNNNNNNNITTGLSVSFFAKQDANSAQWQKTIQVNPNGQVYFMISVANNSAVEVDNVNVSANIPSEISSLGNLQINGVLVSGDIVSGISVGSISPSSAKAITFEGKTQDFTNQGTKQATATSSVSGSTLSDSLSINLNPGQVAGASVSSSQTTSGWSGFWAWLKRWYLWILVALVLIFLFIVIFRRLSNNAE